MWGWVTAVAPVAYQVVVVLGAVGVAVFGIWRGIRAATQLRRAWRRHRESGAWVWSSAVSTRKAQLDVLREINGKLGSGDGRGQ